uniref:Uncharacterized protein n=1 Tax=Moniliophthora roreri TaxID=221103 RepID=A0A0W0FA79_MONRR
MKRAAISPPESSVDPEPRQRIHNPGGQSLSYLTGEDDPNTTISSPQASPQSL